MIRSRRITRRGAGLVAALATAVVGLGVLAPTGLAGGRAPGPAVTGAWARATAAGVAEGAVYFTIRGGTRADSLTGVSVARKVALSASLHRSSMDSHGMMSMAPVKAVPVPAGGKVAFQPGGYHVMLMGLASPLGVGARFALKLTFARAGPRTVTVTVRR